MDVQQQLENERNRRLAASTPQAGESNRIADQESALPKDDARSEFARPLYSNQDRLSAAEMEDVLRMQDAIRALLPHLPARIAASMQRALDRHSEDLLDMAHNKVLTVHCFALIRDVLRFVAEDTDDARHVLT